MNNDLVDLRPHAEGLPVSVLSWDAIHSDRPTTLRGHVGLHIPKWRLRLYGCAAFFSTVTGEAWIMPPSKPLIGRGGVVARDKSGKTIYVGCLEFDDRTSA
ncbi:hypothetical protein AB4144_31650, partial [Rhizobiaceae sp. 2RAB30]